MIKSLSTSICNTISLDYIASVYAIYDIKNQIFVSWYKILN